MAHDLYAKNPALSTFHMAGSWSHLLAQCGAYFPFHTREVGVPSWYMLHDERMTTHFHYPEGDEEGERRAVIDKDYPAILCNCGFEVTEEEAKVLARIARNYAALQRTLKEPTKEEDAFDAYPRPFPRYIRRDWVEHFEEFADWAEQSQGFHVH